MIEDLQIEKIVDIVHSASEEVLKIYNQASFKVETKKDNTPLTLADKVSQDIIIKGLKKHYPDIPIISEESEQAGFKTRESWDCFWLVDPLDGTKEFIKRNGEFTVNVALIYRNTPFLGVVSIPALKVIYFGQKEKGSFKKDLRSTEPIFANKDFRQAITLVRSRSHASRKEEGAIASLGKIEQVCAGSSLKFCYVAEGKADVYLRFSRTMEWDTAAGQCIAENAGGKVFDLQGNPLRYNKESLYNSGFFCISGLKEIEDRLKSYLKSDSGLSIKT
ncbi:MAG: 3'(2'),5'-bisphosphate nucleotidase CysQ [Candidatus Omnitrophica bacterium]|nr:3'(2'),5'-bisphosphate nucleotidase CysQ [Candidatus Omnitrophota bacterium]